jgi:ubiquitin-associated SH3 domain-containing protein
MSISAAELIVYACPSGPLAEQLATYFERSLREVGPNAAHGYMPHVTLTGFFHDDAAAITAYGDALTAAIAEMPPPDANALRVDGMHLMADFLYLKIESPWLIAMSRRFAHHAHSPTRRDALRLKDWLHLSLAYQFPDSQHQALTALARGLVDPFAPTTWAVRVYERDGARWAIHGEWPI